MANTEICKESRRSFLKTGASVGGGLILGFYLPSIVSGQARAPQARTAAAAPFAPNGWLRISADDTVTIVCPACEIGQGSSTSMLMLVAEELDADWNKVRLEWAPADPAYGNPLRGGKQETVASISVRGYWKPLREAGAAARAMVAAAAAQTWGVEEGSCSTVNGAVIHNASGRRLRYGALVEKASKLPVPRQVSLKDQKQFRMMGKAFARLDRKSTRLNSSHIQKSRMPSSA